MTDGEWSHTFQLHMEGSADLEGRIYMDDVEGLPSRSYELFMSGATPDGTPGETPEETPTPMDPFVHEAKQTPSPDSSDPEFQFEELYLSNESRQNEVPDEGERDIRAKHVKLKEVEGAR